MDEQEVKKPAFPSLFGLLKPYRRDIVALIVLALLINGITLWLPKITSHGIDTFLRNESLTGILVQFGVAAIGIFVFTYLQGILQTYASERVARDLRRDLSAKISTQSYASVQRLTPAKLLTNLTSDIDSIKMFVAQAIVNIVSSLCIIIGAAILLFVVVVSHEQLKRAVKQAPKGFGSEPDLYRYDVIFFYPFCCA